MREVHKVNEDGVIPLRATKRRKMMDDYCNGNTAEEELQNEATVSFNQYDFKAKLYEWILVNNVPFSQVESDQFKALLTYLQERTKPHIPSHQTVSRTIASIYDRVLGEVTETLQSAITKINISFDLWTSKNKLALLGICAHFINKNGQPVTILLALPRQKGRHKGIYMAETIS